MFATRWGGAGDVASAAFFDRDRLLFPRERVPVSHAAAKVGIAFQNRERVREKPPSFRIPRDEPFHIALASSAFVSHKILPERGFHDLIDKLSLPPERLCNFIDRRWPILLVVQACNGARQFEILVGNGSVWSWYSPAHIPVRRLSM